MHIEITAISGPPFMVPLYTILSGEEPIILLKSSQATSSSCLLMLGTSFNISVSVNKSQKVKHIYDKQRGSYIDTKKLKLWSIPMWRVTWSFPLEDFFHGMMIEDLPLHLRREVITATRNKEPVVIPVIISRVRSQAGFEALWCFEACSAGTCFELPPGCDWAGEAPAPTTEN